MNKVLKINGKPVKDNDVTKVGDVIEGVYNEKPYKLILGSFGSGSIEENEAILEAIQKAYDDLEFEDVLKNSVPLDKNFLDKCKEILKDVPCDFDEDIETTGELIF